MAKNIVVKVDSVSKDFKLPHERVDSVKSIFVNPFSTAKNRKSETQHALKNISFDVKEGEFFGIVGRNGSGKSTLLKLIAGIYQPTHGQITVNGRLVPFIELGVGFNPDLSGRENVYLNGALMGFSTADVDEKYDDIVKFSELQRFMDQKLKNYSSGMQVRLAFSVATILAESDILLIDEVLAVGDADFQRKCYDYFSSLKKKGKTVIFVSHDMGAVREYCDRAVLIEKSEVVAIGSSSDISLKYSRMFLDKQSQASSGVDAKRWGDKKGQYVNVKTNVYGKNDESRIRITATVKAKENMDDAVLGFTVKNSKGTALMGTNTKLRQLPTPMQAGESREVVWDFDDIFSDGVYTADVSLEYDHSTKVADWWEDAGTFVVRKIDRVPYPFNPPVKVNSELK